ncbi:DNA polymerase III subunit beta [Nocardia terpenica]|uniref:DNA polymerase III subunit beta n=1 Tax=Nocardia terpenica TaxID=455432 RepID=UPI001893EA4D|nr:DNA polymerase III subunit beta [Nocardia terpenica]MBF6063953.1 DNA polymerase III subunit beta [Nocardia terpenica]MBF6107811.1 DNA polymerase III subunit beta [Nocardia terpenica]MBF6114879.1 DNA polymerase III subunit beta [Nocardia terpenica]MBF6121134.1 DNA polymerase III subunit beta [Nocardia terpenica]MBF6153324.1 DNA polymerase III subunit beta [Nocardia terpenica]
MRLRMDRDALAAAVAAVGPGMPNRPPVPTLGGILIRAADGSVSMSGFDYEVSACATVTGTVAESGAVLVSGRLLTEITKTLPLHPVELFDDGSALHIECEQARFSLPLMPVEDYPDLPAAAAARGSVDRADFAAAVAQVAVAAGRDDTLPMLTGMTVEFHPDFIRLVATDRFRIAVRELDWVAEQSGSTLLAPARALVDTTKVLTGERVEISTGTAQSVLGLRTSHDHHTIRLLDLPYAPYQRYLTVRHPARARLRTAAVVEAVRRVALLSQGTRILLSFTESSVRLAAGDVAQGRAEHVLPCEYSGDPVTVAFNPRYLLDGLTTVRTPAVDIALDGPRRGAAIRPADDESTPNRQWYFVMPVRLPE